MLRYIKLLLIRFFCGERAERKFILESIGYKIEGNVVFYKGERVGTIFEEN